MMLIVACHIAQCYGLKIAFLLNVGVQLFFFLSGFLYGKLDQPKSSFEFYWKRFFKVYLPYIIWVFLIIVVYTVFGLYRVSLKQIVLYLLNLQWFVTPIEGLNHLWFLTVLMICYLMTPWVKKLLVKRPALFVAFFMACCIVEFLFVKKFYSIVAWVALYLTGMLFGTYYSKTFSSVVMLVSAMALTVLSVRFSPDMLANEAFREYSIWLHWILGLFLFVTLFHWLPILLDPQKQHCCILHLDKLSYEVYLIHHPLIMGPLSLLFMTKYCWLNIIIVLFVVYVLARLFYLMCTKISL